MRCLHSLVILLDMYQIDAAKYFDAISILQSAITAVATWPGDSQTKAMKPEGISKAIHNLERLEVVIALLSVPVTKLAIRDGKQELKASKNLKYIECGQLLLNISNTLKRELEAVKLFSLDARRADFYEPAEPLFGTSFQSKFPSVTVELDQAGKCYACGLSTAAAFHWIRCLEAGVRAMTRCLSLPEASKGRERNWSIITNSIRDEIERRWPKATGRMSGDAKLFDKLLASLTELQNPYRNETMHLDATYSSGEALHLFEVVKGLMNQIASRMDEDGLPQA